MDQFLAARCLTLCFFLALLAPFRVGAQELTTYTSPVNGFSFAVLLAIAERNRSIDSLRTWRVGVWGALTTGAVGWLAFRDWTFVAICAAAGFGTSALALWIARRAVAGGVGGGSDASFGG